MPYNVKRMTWNPLLAFDPARLAPLKATQFTSDIRDAAVAEVTRIGAKLDLALTQLKTGIVPAFYVCDGAATAKDGFTVNADLIPWLPEADRPVAELPRLLRYYWPTHRGVPMRWYMSFRFGLTLPLLADLCQFPHPDGCGSTLLNPFGINRPLETLWYIKAYWLHVFISCRHDYEDAAPDCAVRLVRADDHDGFMPANDAAHADYCQRFQAQQLEATADPDGHMPAIPGTLLKAPVLGFERDAPPTSKQRYGVQSLDTPPHTVFTLFGAPRSQQIPLRPTSPNNYMGLAACMPVVNFNDADHDMTYQVYSDMRGDILHQTPRSRYSKLDVSCT